MTKTPIATATADEASLDLLELAEQLLPNLDRERQTPEPAQDEPRPRRPVRALCVDDVADAADTLAALLELLGCETRACYSGAGALEIFDQFRPDVCFLDLSMPGMDGIELASRLRSCVGSRALFLVAVTALGSLEARTKTAVTGFHYHLIKPVDGATLAWLVNQFCEVIDPVGRTKEE